jgi:hypothetical protein
VTNQRAIIMQGFGYRNLYGLPLERSTTVLIREGFSGVDWWRRSRAGDTIGTISFAGYTMGAGDNEHTPSFNRIEDARQVFALIERVKGGGGERSLWS